MQYTLFQRLRQSIKNVHCHMCLHDYTEYLGPLKRRCRDCGVIIETKPTHLTDRMVTYHTIPNVNKKK